MLEKNNNPEPEEEDEQELLYGICGYCNKKIFHTRLHQLTFSYNERIVWRCNECRISMQNFREGKGT
jgi:hypothetical protein